MRAAGAPQSGPGFAHSIWQGPIILCSGQRITNLCWPLEGHIFRGGFALVPLPYVEQYNRVGATVEKTWS
jgi:hypothetical protein